MRRLAAAPPTDLASAAGKAAVFAFDAVLIALFLLRFHLVPFMPGLAALTGGLAVALLALALAVAAFVAIWRKGVRGFGRAVVAFSLALLMLAPAAFAAALALSVPEIVDISTDVVDPPALSFAARVRPPDANPAAYDPANIARQHEAFPQIRSMLVDLPADDMRKLVLRLVRDRRWQIVGDIRLAETAARVRLPDIAPMDRIEAVAASTLFGTIDDIAIRIRTEDGKSRIDMRSAARFGAFDFGVNAGRVERFMADLRDLALLPDQASQ
ncbi:DUF1499 domain-containing protein [Labrys monachus]|uniref:DUF1499 domain-containing protein n=1 Tax=Labrys monachus TaxID=217067 RepID=A0ABU0FAU3_9HYPH|nr:DUF1499 domain-containing protein [Labrys monachus]MDQ0391738.1 hypothetical protein [Labrys monachus]